MLAEQDDRIDAERASDASEQPSSWLDVYKTMRCPGPPCQYLERYCWQDSVGKSLWAIQVLYRSYFCIVVKCHAVKPCLDCSIMLRDRILEAL